MKTHSNVLTSAILISGAFFLAANSAWALDGKAKLSCNISSTASTLDRIEWDREAGTVTWIKADGSESIPLVSSNRVDGSASPLSDCKVQDRFIPGTEGAPDRYSLYVRCGTGHQVGLTVTDGENHRGFYMLRLEPVQDQVERQMKLLAACE